MYNGFFESCNGLFSIGRYHFGGIGMIIGLVLIVIIVFLIFKKNDFDLTGKNHDTPLDNLQTRFINGEIDKDEYLEKKRILENK